MDWHQILAVFTIALLSLLQCSRLICCSYGLCMNREQGRDVECFFGYIYRAFPALLQASCFLSVSRPSWHSHMQSNRTRIQLYRAESYVFRQIRVCFFGPHRRLNPAFTPTEMNQTFWANKLDFEFSGLNRAAVNAPLDYGEQHVRDLIHLFIF